MTHYKGLIALGLCLVLSPSQANQLEDNLQQASKNLQSAASSQQKIDELYDGQREALQQVRITQAEIDQLTVYNRQLSEIIANQTSQKASLKKQIQDIEVTQQGIMPLMERMLTGLEAFIKLDTPFLLAEREQRIATLRSLLVSAEVTVSEKFRRVLEAFQIEIEYGRTIEAYRGEMADGQTVDFLRLGRVGLYAITLDGGQAQVWNSKNDAWSDVADGYHKDIQNGLRIARKQSAPQLLSLLIPTVEAN